MKTHIIGALLATLFLSLPAFSQNPLGSKVAAVHIDKYESYNDIERDIIRDVKIHLLNTFERNGFETASIENEDRVMSNLLNAINFRDAEVRSEQGDTLDFIFTIWIEDLNGNYKIYSHRIGRYNTDDMQGAAVKKEILEKASNTRLAQELDKLNTVQNELIAFKIAEQFVSLSTENRTRLEEIKKEI